MSTAPHPTADLPRGRRRDPSRDEAITDAAIELLIRVGYDRLTVEAVAAEAGVGKATVYRRWAGKAELVIDALATLKPGYDTIDTGSLDGDIEEMAAASCSPQSQRLMQVMTSVCSALPREPDLLDAFRTRFTEPRIARLTEILERAARRGELGPHVDVAVTASLLPSLMLHRALTTGRPPGHEYAEQIVTTVLRPVLGLPARPSNSPRRDSDD